MRPGLVLWKTPDAPDAMGEVKVERAAPVAAESAALSTLGVPENFGLPLFIYELRPE